MRFPRYLEQDDVVLAVGLGLVIGGVAVGIGISFALVLSGLVYVSLAVVMSK